MLPFDGVGEVGDRAGGQRRHRRRGPRLYGAAQRRPSSSSISGFSRNDGPDTDSDATHLPAPSKTGAATAVRPSSSSATAVAYPRRRTSSSSAVSAW